MKNYFKNKLSQISSYLIKIDYIKIFEIVYQILYYLAILKVCVLYYTESISNIYLLICLVIIYIFRFKRISKNIYIQYSYTDNGVPVFKTIILNIKCSNVTDNNYLSFGKIKKIILEKSENKDNFEILNISRF